MNIEELCGTLNNKVFEYKALIVDYSNPIPVIKVSPAMSYKLVKKLNFDDLITFLNGKPKMTIRLQNYAIEFTNSEIVVTRDCFFF